MGRFFDKNLKIYILFGVLAFGITFVSFFYPFLKYPFDAPNPWPEAYNVIQQEIIDQEKVPPQTIPQFGERQKIDMTYFLNHHLMLTSFRLIDGLPFETNERFLSFALTLIIFLSSFLLFEYLFGKEIGLFAGILFIFLPRNLNYYINVNGEFLSLIILFLALYFWFRFWKERKKIFLVFFAFFAGILPIICLITFGVFLLVIFAHLITMLITTHKKRLLIFKRGMFSIGVIIFATLILAVVPLLITKDIKPGGSSSIGSLFSQRSESEIEFEKSYYKEFATYGNNFIDFPPFIRDVYFLSLDGQLLDYFFIIYIPLFILGMIVILKFIKQKEVLFIFVLIVVFLLVEILLYSPIFNFSVYNSALRFLLYFELPLIFSATIGFAWLYFKNRYVLYIFVPIIIILSIPIIKFSAWSGNSYTALYAPAYKKTLLWLKENTPEDSIVISNDWTNGQFWLKAKRLNIVEAGKASATYSTYEKIYNKLNESRNIFRTDITKEETLKIIKEREIEYIIVWNRPSSYYIYPFLQAKNKLESLKFNKVFEEKESVEDPNNRVTFEAESIIYAVETSQLPQ